MGRFSVLVLKEAEGENVYSARATWARPIAPSRQLIETGGAELAAGATRFERMVAGIVEVEDVIRYQDQHFEVIGVTPRGDGFFIDVDTQQVDGEFRILEPLTIGGEPVTIGGEPVELPK